MAFFKLESSKTAYRADFVVYAVSVLSLGAALVLGPSGSAWPLLAAFLTGYVLWTTLEYGLHRFVLHGLQPFQGMHEQHHLQPGARIGTPTAVSLPLFVLLAFAPAWALAGPWLASALTLGLVSGYLAYAITHHVCHHGRASNAMARRLRRWHTRHHRSVAAQGCYGVSLRLWDHVFRTALAPSPMQTTRYWRLK